MDSSDSTEPTGSAEDAASTGQVAHRLHAAGVPVAEYVLPARLPVTLSPRPYLHPVRTLAGTVVTEARPADHAHHLGVSLAVADVDGTSFWGGRTYVRGIGPRWLGNHGTQRHERLTAGAAEGFTEELSWVSPSGEVLLTERRAVSAQPAATGDAWLLHWSSRLVNATPRRLRIGSPATSGRAGAGYGGFFWRAPAPAGHRRILLPGGQEGEDRAHGARAPWVCLSGRDPTGVAWSLVLAQIPTPGRAGAAATWPLPWFVRLAEYPGLGPALAWTEPLWLEPGAELGCGCAVAVADGQAGHDRAASLAAEATQAGAAATGEGPATSGAPPTGD